jgi:hypothetical protein
MNWLAQLDDDGIGAHGHSIPKPLRRAQNAHIYVGLELFYTVRWLWVAGCEPQRLDGPGKRSFRQIAAKEQRHRETKR